MAKATPMLPAPMIAIELPPGVSASILAALANVVGHARDDALDFLDTAALRIDILGHHLAASHDHDPREPLKHMVDVVGNENAGVSRVPRASHEAQHALGFSDA